MKWKISTLLLFEKRALRKAEMEFAKAENMIEHRDEIYGQKGRGSGNPCGNELISADIAEDLKDEGEEKTRTREVRLSVQKNLPREKRRKLEAAREMLEDDEEEEDGKRQEEEARIRYERSDTSGSWLQASQGCKGKTESN
ncbi:hypothetical protein Bca101_023734 [Brassica carinata]